MTATATTSRWTTLVEPAARTLIAGSLAGAIAGFLWGGVGGRIAMRIVFLTTTRSVGGFESDDGFTIGVISSATFFLVAATTMLGAVLGAVAAVLRSFMRTRTVVAAAAFSAASAAFFGSAIVHTDGIDFRLLSPLFLTIGLFLFLPAAWAATTIVLLDKMLQPKSRISRLPRWFLALALGFAALPLIALGGSAVVDFGIRGVVGIAVVAAAGLAIVLRRSHGHRLGTAAHWAVWGILAALSVVGMIGLAEDIAGLT